MEEKNFSDIDPNFKQKNETASALKYHSVTKKPIVLEGLPFVAIFQDNTHSSTALPI